MKNIFITCDSLHGYFLFYSSGRKNSLIFSLNLQYLAQRLAHGSTQQMLLDSTLKTLTIKR